MTELSFLLELLLNHKLSQTTKKVISARIKEVETKLNQPQVSNNHGSIVVNSPYIPYQDISNNIPVVKTKNQQSPSMRIAVAELEASQALKMQNQAANTEVGTQPIMEAQPNIPAQPEQPAQPLVIAKTVAAAQALQRRNESIAQAISGKEEKGRTSPRKF